MGKPVENSAKNDKNPQSFPQGKNDVFVLKTRAFAVFFHSFFKKRFLKSGFQTAAEKATITHAKRIA